MDEFSKSDTTLATTTSGLRISEMQKAARRHPERCITVHRTRRGCFGRENEQRDYGENCRIYEDDWKEADSCQKGCSMNGSKQVGSRAVERSCKSRSQRNSKPEEIDIAVKYGAGNRLTYHLGGGTGGIEIF